MLGERNHANDARVVELLERLHLALQALQREHRGRRRRDEELHGDGPTVGPIASRVDDREPAPADLVLDHEPIRDDVARFEEPLHPPSSSSAFRAFRVKKSSAL